MKLLVLVLTLNLNTFAMNTTEQTPDNEQITLGGGCFWCIEAVFERVEGITNAVSGYAGGNTANPDYQAVCTGNTGHAEVVQLTFNPDIISVSEILEIFFKIHDPSTINRQGNDVGTQYRSVIFYHNKTQKYTADKIISELKEAGTYSKIVTQVFPLDTFYVAEDYHQDYFRKNPNKPYCALVVAPKVKKLEKLFTDKVKDE